MIKALIVEDEQDVREKLVLMIKMLNSELSQNVEIVGGAEHYEQAVELFNEHKPDIVLLDNWLNQKHKSGIDFFEQHLSKEGCYTIFITGIDPTGSLNLLLDPLGIPVLDKPIDSDVLRQLLQNYINVRGKDDFKNNLARQYEAIQRLRKEPNLRLVRIGNVTNIEMDRIVFIRPEHSEPKGQFTSVVYFKDHEPIPTRINLSDWERRLCKNFPTVFYRFGDKAILNRDYLYDFQSPDTLRLKTKHIDPNSQTPDEIKISEMAFSAFKRTHLIKKFPH